MCHNIARSRSAGQSTKILLLDVQEAVLCLSEARSRSAGQSHLYTALAVPEAALCLKIARSITSMERTVLMGWLEVESIPAPRLAAR